MIKTCNHAENSSLALKKLVPTFADKPGEKPWAWKANRYKASRLTMKLPSECYQVTERSCRKRLIRRGSARSSFAFQRSTIPGQDRQSGQERRPGLRQADPNRR